MKFPIPRMQTTCEKTTKQFAWLLPLAGLLSALLTLTGASPIGIRPIGIEVTPTLGNYPATTIPLSTDTTVSPTAAPTNATSMSVFTSTDFKGKLEGNPATGVVRVTDAHPAGTYTVTVKAFNSSGGSASTTFSLAVTTVVAGDPVSFAAPTSFGAGVGPYLVAVGDFNGDGRQDLAVANEGSASVSILLRDCPPPYGCTVCHKHTVTLSLACGSLELQRHLDHGDTLGTCESAAAPLIISPLSIFGNINRQLVYQIVATGNPQSYVAANLPAGLALDPVLGIISGIPIVGGTTAVTITVANSQGMDVRTLNLTTFDPSLFPNPPFIANVGSLTARTGQPFVFDVIGSGLDSNHVVSTAGSAPGIVFRPLTSDLVGIPQEDGSFAINFIIHTPPPLDDLIYNIQTLQVTFVSDSALPVITSAATVILVPGEPFTYTITAPNTAAPDDHNHYSLIGTLPSGLVFDSNAGTISGTYSPAARQILNAGVAPVGSLVDTVTLVAQNSHGVATLPLTFLLP